MNVKPVLLLVALSAATMAEAAPRAAAAASSSLMTALVACRAETDDAKRLACYDDAAGKLADATAKGDVKVVTRDDVRATRRSLFGFELPKVPFFTGDDSANEVPIEMDAVVRSVRDDGYSKFTLTMESGAVWSTTEPLPRDPKPGAKVKLKRGALGSYFMMVNGGRSVRAMRVR